jgi:alpha-L-arabinofuranosidase
MGNKVTNRFGFPEYFDLAKRMGWKTILVANLRDALYNKKPLPEAAAHAAALLDYGIKHAAPGSIAAFQVGNEGWFFWPPKPEEREALGITDLDHAALRLRAALVAYADAARKVNPKIPLICDAPRPDDGGGLDNDAGRVWRQAVDHPDIRARYQFLAAHGYGPLGLWTTTRNGEKLDRKTLSEDDVWFGCLASLGRFDASGQNLADSRAYDEIARLGFKSAVTEWNWSVWAKPETFPQVHFKYGVPAALGSAGFLHGLIRHPNVALATQSMMLGTAWGITSVRVLTDGSVIHGPQAEPVRLYAERHGAQLLASKLEGVPAIEAPVVLASWWPQAPRLALLDAVVTADPGRLFVHLINRSRTEEMPLEIQLPPGRLPSGSARLTTLTGDLATVTTGGKGRLVRATRELPDSGSVISIVLPAASVSVLEIPLSPVVP